MSHLRRHLFSEEVAKPKAKILLVDDNEVLREVHAELLESAGVQVAKAENFHQGRRFLDLLKFDLVIFDNNLTNNILEQKGLQLAEYRSETRNARTPAIIITGDGTAPDYEERAKAAGVETFKKGKDSLLNCVLSKIESLGLQRA